MPSAWCWRRSPCDWFWPALCHFCRRDVLLGVVQATGTIVFRSSPGHFGGHSVRYGAVRRYAHRGALRGCPSQSPRIPRRDRAGAETRGWSGRAARLDNTGRHADGRCRPAPRHARRSPAGGICHRDLGAGSGRGGGSGQHVRDRLVVRHGAGPGSSAALQVHGRASSGGSCARFRASTRAFAVGS